MVMKKNIIALAGVALTSALSVAQNITTSPVVYMPDDQVTWYIDLSEQMTKEGEPMYMWTWAPSNPEDVVFGGSWDEPSDECKLNYEGNGIYSWTLVPTTYYGKDYDWFMDPANDDIFWFNIRNEAKEAITGSLHAPRPFHDEYLSFINSESDIKVFPAQFTARDRISVMVNTNMLTVGGVQGAWSNENEIHMHGGANEWDGHNVDYNAGVAELIEKTMFKNLGNGIFRLDMTPANYFGISDDELADGYQMNNFTFVLATKDWAANVGNFKFNAAGIEPDPDPEFSYFPQRLSKYDFLTLTRTFDDNAANLSYSVKGGKTELKGDFDGSRSKRVATVDLLTGFDQESDLTSVHVTILRGDAVVLELDLPLV